MSNQTNALVDTATKLHVAASIGKLLGGTSYIFSSQIEISFILSMSSKNNYIQRK